MNRYARLLIALVVLTILVQMAGAAYANVPESIVIPSTEIRADTPSRSLTHTQMNDSARAIAGRIERAIILQTNNRRAARGLGSLTEDTTLRSIARWMCRDMARYQYLGHIDHLGRDFWQRYEAWGYPYVAGAENNAAGFADAGTPSQIARQVMNLWMASPSYRNYILGGYTRIGVGVTYGTVVHSGNVYTGWVVIQDFARQ